MFLLFQISVRISAASKMELFLSWINGFPLLTNVTNNILDVGFHRFGLDFRFLDMAHILLCVQVMYVSYAIIYSMYHMQ